MTVNFKVDNLKNMKSELNAFCDLLRSSGATDDDIFAGKLVACELITNVIRHGGDEAEFSGEVEGDKIVITVPPESLKGVDLKRPAPDIFAESGRGLYIIRSLCYGDIERDGGEIKVFIKKH